MSEVMSKDIRSGHAPVTASEKIADNCGFHPSAKILSEDKRDGL
jgi:hypothetical protein